MEVGKVTVLQLTIPAQAIDCGDVLASTVSSLLRFELEQAQMIPQKIAAGIQPQQISF
jgi:hypothetical protein